MKYLSIDLETTGLNPTRSLVLEFGCVYDDGSKPVEELPWLRLLLKHDVYYGEARALSMNAKILDEIEAGGPHVITPNELFEYFAQWLNNLGIDRQKKLVAAGKQFAGFDRNFLRTLPGFDVPGGVNFHHRALDPTMLYFDPDTDEVPPGTEECCKRAGIEAEGLHTSIGDARTVCRLIRRGFARRQFNVVSEETNDSTAA
jgi:hypothetical protein